MENTSLSIQSVLSEKDNYNLAIPFVQTQQINPFYKTSVSLLYVDINEQASQIFKVGTKSLGNNQWETLYSLAKPFLQKLATEAGIQFGPGSGDVVKMDENTWKASAFGALRLPDGSVRTSNNFKIIDLVTIEKKYRLAYEEKAERGITDPRAAKAAAEKYAGEWRGKAFFIAEQDREKYIEKSLLDAMTKLRDDAPQKAITGAKLRIVRDLLGIKGSYTMAELKKPFVVARMSFSPDYNDPLVRQMMLQQAIYGVGNLYGNSAPVIQAMSVPEAAYEEGIIEQPVEITEPLEAPPEYEDNAERPDEYCCDKCGETIPKRVWEYSMEHDGYPLCMKCQKIFRNEQRGANR